MVKLTIIRTSPFATPAPRTIPIVQMPFVNRLSEKSRKNPSAVQS